MNSNNPVVCKLLIIIAWLNFIGGIIAGIIYFASEQTFMGFAVIVGGGVGAVLFWGISEIISYLDVISENIYSLAGGLGKTTNNSAESSPLFQAVPSENEWKCRCGKINPKEFTSCPKCSRPFEATV